MSRKGGGIFRAGPSERRKVRLQIGISMTSQKWKRPIESAYLLNFPTGWGALYGVLKNFQKTRIMDYSPLGGRKSPCGEHLTRNFDVASAIGLGKEESYDNPISTGWNAVRLMVRETYAQGPPSEDKSQQILANGGSPDGSV